MKRIATFPLFALFLLSACGGGSGDGGSPAPPPPPPVQRYNVGGTITGLAATGLVLTNGADTLAVDSTATTFKFPTMVNSGGSYSVAISLQPSGEHCTLANATGTVGSADVSNVTVTCTARQWTWLSGSQSADQVGTIGTQGVPGTQNTPGARSGSASWTDKDGNFWIFSGEAPNQTGNYPQDLWKYSPADGTWTWVAGLDPTTNSTALPVGVYGTLGVPSAANVPGGRHWAATWVDATGNLWLFGGIGADGHGNWGWLNDLWKFTPATGQWTWVSGSDTYGAVPVPGTQGVAAASNVPGGRSRVQAWTDGQSNLWLYGGIGTVSANVIQGVLGDLWKFDTSTSMWTWVGGVTTANAVASFPPKGTSTASATPGGRYGSVTWTDKAGEFWLFGGVAYLDATSGGVLDDLWKYAPATGTWTWAAGTGMVNAAPRLGTQGVAAAANGPGSFADTVTWTDAAGQLWLFGGFWYDVTPTSSTTVYSNQLWEFRPATGMWTWVTGSATTNASGTYGTLGNGAPGNTPGARYLAVGGTDAQGNFLLFGGQGFGGPNQNGHLNDLWRF